MLTTPITLPLSSRTGTLANDFSSLRALPTRNSRKTMLKYPLVRVVLIDGVYNDNPLLTKTLARRRIVFALIGSIFWDALAEPLGRTQPRATQPDPVWFRPHEEPLHGPFRRRERLLLT